MNKINVGDVVKKKACSLTGPEVWVTVLEKRTVEAGRTHPKFIEVTVLRPDGEVVAYRQSMLKKYKDVWA